jgi:hypothetical protein
MTSYSRREVTTIRVEYTVDAPARGSGEANYWHGLRDALYALTKEIGPDRASQDDAVRVEAHDGQIVLSYDAEARPCPGYGRMWKSAPGGGTVCPVCGTSSKVITYPDEPHMLIPEHVGAGHHEEKA